MLDSFVVCDLETTGLSPRQHEIIEIGMVRVESGEITASFHSLVRPVQKLPVSIRRLTGLDDNQLKTGPGLPEVLPQVLAFLHDYPLVGHNVAFDKSFLEAAAGPLKNPVYDTLELARILLPASPGYRLGVLCRFLGVENQNEHRSLSDALATVELYRKLVVAIKKLDAQVLLQLNSFLQRANSSWVAPLTSMMRQVAGQNMNVKITGPVFFSSPIRNAADPFSPGRQQETGFSDSFPETGELSSLLAAGGILATRLEGYEYRPQQQEMVRAVSRALEEQKYLLMEAGTGSGKSMSYLIPVLHWAIKNDQRVVISTRTINLQEQLWEKDVPALLGTLSWPCKAALVKGRQNYLCLRRWLSTLTAGNWTPEEAAFYARVLVWVTGTATGDKAELNLTISEQDSWVQICADSEGCLGTRCRWFKSACYVTRAHRAAEAAKLIITNHSLLFSDVRVENKVLPAYGPLVIDEAHHLEDAATEQLGCQVTWSAVRRWFFAVNRLLTRLGALVPPDDVALWQRTIKEAQDVRQQAAQSADVFFHALCTLVIARADTRNQEVDRWTLRLKFTSEERETPFLEAEYANLKVGWAGLSECLHRLVSMLEEWSSASDGWGDFYSEVDQQFSIGSGLGMNLGFILACREDNYVYWIDVARGNDNRSCSLHAVPVQVGKILHEQLFQQKDTIVLTSATLTVEGSFQHFMERTGLDLVSQDSLLKLQVDSPFSYEHQSLLCVVRDVPLQNEVSEEEYLEALLATLSGLIKTVQGKTLVLFTSHRVLKETYRRLKGVCEEADIHLLAHNIDGSRSRLIEEFRNNERTVLLGASSFWEGIDIPGEALSCVAIVKLPFWAPSIPVIEARIEELARQGKDAFRHFSLPQAVIRFKQGFGRLIRTMRDKGVVVVLDHRIVNKQYGRRFLNSLPIRSHIRGDAAMVNKRIAQWLKDSL